MKLSCLFRLAAAVLLVQTAVLPAQNPGSSGGGTGGGNSPSPSPGTSPIWRQALGGAVLGAPSVQAETITLVCEGGNLQTYTTEGAFLWSYFARGRLSPYVSRSPEGTSYICRTNGILIAINRAGRELWRINLNSPVSSPVIIGWDGRLFVFTKKNLRCYTASGYPLWHRDLEYGAALSPLPDSQGGLVLVTENRELLEIDPFGAQVSRKLAGMPVLALPMAAKPGEEPGAVLLLYENGRAEISGRKTEPRFLSSLGNAPLAGVCRGSNAAVTLNNGRVVLLATDSGRILWTGESRIGAGIGDELRMIYDERGIYVLSKSGAAGFTEDGRRLWLLKLEGAAAVPAFGDEGILYSGGNDWILYAYRLEDRVKQRRFSLYGAIPEGNYGTANPLPSSRGDYYFRFDEEELDIYLGQIREAVRRGQIGTEEREFTAYLMETAGSLVHSPRDTRMQPQVHTRHRVEAARLLGYIGSRETIPFLANLYYRDQDSTVKAAAAEAIGRIGVDPGGEALKAFSSLIFPPVPYRDEQVLTATAAATGALCRFSGPPLSSTGIRLLVVLSGDDRPRVVRERARQELATLR